MAKFSVNSPSKILLVHNFYHQLGGEDVVVANEQVLLAQRGHEVRLWSVNNDAIDNSWMKIKTALTVPYSRSALDGMRLEISEFAPDLVHVHNFFPLLTPSIYDACLDARVPVVQTLHNYRTICAGETLFRRGRPCEDCIVGSPYQGAIHGCFLGSRLGSLAVARMVDIHRKRGTWRTKVDRLIALTSFAKSKFVEAGLPSDKLAVKPNFVPDIGKNAAVSPARRGALFVGRLSSEKGIRTLLEAWSSLDVGLRVVGRGPLQDCVENSGIGVINCLGWEPPNEVAAEMGDAAFLVMPSECYEGFPMVIVEAFCQGLPVIASRLGAMAEVVEDKVTGLHFEHGDPVDLAAKVRWAVAHPDEMRRMGRNARRVYEAKYTPEVNYGQLMDVYKQAIESNCRSQRN